jgi:hypothetical protein
MIKPYCRLFAFVVAGLQLLTTHLPAPSQAAEGPPQGAAAAFTRLIPLPRPKIVASAEAYPGGSFNVTNITDGILRTEYSSSSKGTNTFIEFDFGALTRIAGFRHVDRNDPATVAASELVFTDLGGGVVSTASVTHINRRAGVTFMALPSPVSARGVRWRVTELGPQRYATVGGAEIAWFSGAAPETVPLGIAVEGMAFPVLEKRGRDLIQPFRITLNYPYVEPIEAVVRVEGVEPKRLRLELGTQSFAGAVPAVQSAKALNISVEVGGQTVARGEVQLKPVRQIVVYVLPHSHVDIGYTELQTEVEKKQMRNIARGLELARATAQNPEGARYKWNVEVLWAVESYLQQSEGDKQREFIQAVRQGWIGLDAMYGNELTGLCRPEELLRLFRYAKELEQRCGVPIESAMISDVPGYTWGTVQAMAQAGVKYFSIAPNYFDRIGTALEEWENKPFYWVSAGGSEKVLCWVPYYGYALSHVIRELSESFLLDLAARLQNAGYPYDIAYLRWSGHGDNAPPDEQLPQSIKQWNEKYAWPRLLIATTSEAFRAFEQKHGSQLPHVRGDWTPYWEDGAASSARETALNRASAERLVQGEILWAMLSQARFPAEHFSQAWRNVLLYDEHTWGAHNSISQPDLPFVKDQWRIKQGFALDADKQSRKLLAAALASREGKPPLPPGKKVDAIDIFSTTSWLRTYDLVVVPKELSQAGDAVKSSLTGSLALPSQRLTSGELAFRPTSAQPFSVQRCYITDDEPCKIGTPGAKAEGAMLTSSSITLRVDEKTGAIVSLRSKFVDAELADTNGVLALNDYFYLPGSDLKGLQRNGPVKITVKERGPLVASLLIESDAPGCHKLTREIRVHEFVPCVDIINTVDKAPVRAKEGLHFGFAFNVPGGVMRMDVPWAVVRPELDQIPGSCKNWFTVQRWVDISNDQYGVTWVTPDAPMVEVGGITATLIGSQQNPKAWRQHLAPSQLFYSWIMNNHWHTNYRADQEGPTVFRYVIWVHQGPINLSESARFGMAMSQPLIVAPALGKLVKPPLDTVTPYDVLVTAFKPSDDGKAWILRLFGASGKAEQAKLHWRDPQPKAMWLSDISEKPIRKVEGGVDVPAWGIVTLRVELP